MKKNETNWKKWYLANLGREWQEDESHAPPDMTGLDEHAAKVGMLLYERYIKEKQDAETLRYRLAQTEQARDAEGRRAVQNAQAVHRYLPETARAKGLNGTAYAAQTKAAVADSARRAVQTTSEQHAAQADTILRRYQNDRTKADNRLDRSLASTERHYTAVWRQNWMGLRSQLHDMLPAMVSPYDSKAYTAEGVAELRQLVEDNRAELGNRYDEALRWVDGLPVYEGPEGEILHTQKGDVTIGKAEWDAADSVQYRRGAGVTVTKADVFSVNYRGIRYQMKADAAAPEDTASLLDALATAKKVTLRTGTVLYYHGRLYVYNGRGGWLTTRNVGPESSPDNVSHLVKHIEVDMENGR